VRGLVVPLTAEQRVQRMLYLAGEAPLDSLDPFVRKAGAPQDCPSLTYRLRLFNGGKDPTAPDPSTPDPSTPFMGFRFCDCSGAGAWTQGHDRYQPKRAAHVYKGWLNTNSKIADALGARRCFVPVDRPTPGDIIGMRVGRAHRPRGRHRRLQARLLRPATDRVLGGDRGRRRRSTQGPRKPSHDRPGMVLPRTELLPSLHHVAVTDRDSGPDNDQPCETCGGRGYGQRRHVHAVARSLHDRGAMRRLPGRRVRRRRARGSRAARALVHEPQRMISSPSGDIHA
jgi:hypothetical protein